MKATNHTGYVDQLRQSLRPFYEGADIETAIKVSEWYELNPVKVLEFVCQETHRHLQEKGQIHPILSYIGLYEMTTKLEDIL